MAENELIVIKELNPVEVFTTDGIAGVLKTIEEKVLAHVPVLETPAGRKDIASLAFKVARSKTLLDEMGKKLVEEAKKTVKTIDGHRKEVRDTLDGLKEKVRQPLTDWEDEEERRKAEVERIAQEKAQARVDALACVGVSLPFLQAKELSEDDFSAILKEATEAHKAEQDRIADEKRKADERAVALEKERQEEAAKLASERAELEKKQAEENARQKAAWEKIEAEQKAEAARMKAERDKLEAERRAVEDTRREQEHREAIELAKKEAAERAVQEAKERAEREAREKAEAELKAKDESERRAALRPDKEKLIEWANAIMRVPFPETKSDDAQAVFEKCRNRLLDLSNYIIKAAQEL